MRTAGARSGNNVRIRMNLSNLKPAEGSTKKEKRIGRGQGSGRGGTSTRGHKGAKSRSGYSSKIGFEGGQMPLQRRIPKRGFNNIFAKEIVAINVGSLNVFEDGAVVDNEAIIKAGIAKKACDGIKILGNGQLTKNLTVKVSAYSEAAKQKIEAAGGKAEVI